MYHHQPLNIEACIDKIQPKQRQRIKPNSRILPSKAVEIMTEWYDRHYTNPYPSYRDVEIMASHGEITTVQVKQWFVNTRRRTKNQFRRQNSTYNSKKRAVESSYQLVEDIICNQKFKSEDSISSTEYKSHDYSQYDFQSPSPTTPFNIHTAYDVSPKPSFDDETSTPTTGFSLNTPLTPAYNYNYYYDYASLQYTPKYSITDSFSSSSYVPYYTPVSSCNSSASNYGFTCDFSSSFLNNSNY